MNVEIGTETPIFLFWEYLFQNFSILSLQCSVSLIVHYAGVNYRKSFAAVGMSDWDIEDPARREVSTIDEKTARTEPPTPFSWFILVMRVNSAHVG